MDNILVSQGTNEPRVKIGDLCSVIQLESQVVDSKMRIQRCLTTHKNAAPERLLAGFTHSEKVSLAETSTPGVCS